MVVSKPRLAVAAVVALLEAKPVHIAAGYRSLDNGLTYQARSVLRYPDKQLNLTVENFDYQFVARSR